MVSKAVLVSIVALVIVTWVLVSSINTVPQLSNGKTDNIGSTGNTGNKLGNLTGPSGIGTNNLSRGFLFGNFKFPDLNLSRLSFNLSLFNFTLPAFPAFFNFSLPSFGNLFGGKSGSSQSHSTGTSGNSNGNGKTPVNTFKLPPIVVYIIIAVMVVLVAVIASLSVANYRKREKSDSAQQLLEEQVLQFDPEVQNSNSRDAQVFRVKPFKGWKGESDLINPGIPGDLPLVYPVDSDMPVELSRPATLEIDNGNINDSGKSIYNVRLSKGCNTLTASNEEEAETKNVRGVVVREEMSLLLRINLLSGTTIEGEPKTIREISRLLETEGIIKDRRKFADLIEIYERAFYGLKETALEDFQNFLYGIRDTFTEPKMAECGS